MSEVIVRTRGACHRLGAVVRAAAGNLAFAARSARFGLVSIRFALGGGRRE